MSNKYKNISVISTGSWVPSEQDFLAENKETYQVQINELVLMVSIGIHEHEKVKKQRVSISLSIQALDNLDEVDENINNVVSYEQIIKKLKKRTRLAKKLRLLRCFRARLHWFCIFYWIMIFLNCCETCLPGIVEAILLF